MLDTSRQVEYDPMHSETPSNGEAKTGHEQDGITVERVYWGDSGFEEAREIEYNVFLQKQFTTEQEGKGLGEYDDYDFMSTFLIARKGGRTVGVLREIRTFTSSWRDIRDAFSEDPDLASSGLKTLDDFELDGFQEEVIGPKERSNTPPSTNFETFRDRLIATHPELAERDIDDTKSWNEYVFRFLTPREILEVGTVAVPKDVEHPPMDTALRLYAELYQDAIKDGRTTLIASVDAPLFKRLQRLLGFEQVGDTKMYMGSPTTPALLDVGMSLEHVRKKHPILYPLLKGETARDERLAA